MPKQCTDNSAKGAANYNASNKSQDFSDHDFLLITLKK
jgi:hypothetical protein